MFGSKKVEITAPDMRTAVFNLESIAPLVQLRFSQKSKETILKNHIEGSKVKSKKKEGKNIEALFQEAMYISESGEHGIPASSFRAAIVEACKLIGFPMTKAKLAFFIEPDGIDASDGTPLVYIKGKPHLVTHHVRNETGVADIRVRAMFDNWTSELRVMFDAGLFSDEDVTNLLVRAGLQVGIGEGRPNSRKSCGMGWGLFKVA